MSGGAAAELPDGLEDALPAQARLLEACRRTALDRFAAWGYRLVVPPLAEFDDGPDLGGAALAERTFRFPDPQSGRTLRLRADMTPQAARMDRMYFRQDRPARLCYAGPVLRTSAETLGGGRSPVQAGAELYGDDSAAGDAEVALLLCDVLAGADCRPWCLGLGHAGVFHALVADAPWSRAERAELFGCVQRKACADIAVWLKAHPADAATERALRALPDLSGPDESVLERASDVLGGDARIAGQLAELRALGAQVRACHPRAALHYDVGEAPGFRYENGLVFAAYVEGEGREIARGGRYPAGRQRPATGFSLDLRELARCRRAEPEEPARILAPCGGDAAQARAVEQLRAEGRVVVCALRAGDTARELDCAEELVEENGAWVVRPAAI